MAQNDEILKKANEIKFVILGVLRQTMRKEVVKDRFSCFFSEK